MRVCSCSYDVQGITAEGGERLWERENEQSNRRSASENGLFWLFFAVTVAQASRTSLICSAGAAATGARRGVAEARKGA